MRLDAGMIAATFDLGMPIGPATPLAGGSSAQRWTMSTDQGRWMVKTTSSPPAWQLREMRVSGALEQAAFEAGITMPRPVRPRCSAVGLWSPVDAGCYARASEWIDGVPPPSASAALAGWLGRTLAAIDALRLPGDHTAEAAYPIHDVRDWQQWLDEASDAGVLDRTSHLLAAITEATALVLSALAACPVFRLAHRDVSLRNILLTSQGPQLLDFDYAGPEVSWWEFVHHTFALASPDLGHQPPAPEQVRAALTAYVEAGAARGPARPEAFAGLLRATLNTTAYNLWLALGHRPASGERRVAAGKAARHLAVALPGMVRSIDRWSDLIR